MCLNPRDMSKPTCLVVCSVLTAERRGQTVMNSLTKSKIIMADRDSCWLQACRIIDLLQARPNGGSTLPFFWID
jgi:hypothetical protein